MDEPPSSVVMFRRVPPGLRRAKLERFAGTLRDTVAAGTEFECLITDDPELRRLNRKFRGKDYPTDVLSFPLCGARTRACRVDTRVDATGRESTRHARVRATQTLGSIAISFQRASEQAQQFGHSTEQEIQILMLHGLLHLLGFDHENDRGRMARMEAEWRRRLELPGGLIERAHR